MKTPANRFAKIGPTGLLLPADATEWVAVLDRQLDLFWTVEEVPKALPWRQAQEVPGKLTTAGFTDWRMPTVEELFSLADRGRCNPAVNTDYFPATQSDWYWTATMRIASPADCAWIVVFDYGDSHWRNQSHEGFVRACRPRQ